MAKTVTKKKAAATAKKAASKTASKKTILKEAPAKKTKTTKAEKKEALKTIADTSKQELIQNFATKTGDTGSPEVQVALATHKVLNLTAHLEQNPKDNHSRRGLLKVISKRRRILNYLQEKDDKRYKDLVKKLELKH